MTETFGIELVKEACALLDKNRLFGPWGWRNRIDPGILNIEDPFFCPLAQLTRGMYGVEDRPYTVGWGMLFRNVDWKTVSRLDRVFCDNAYLPAWKEVLQ